MVDYYKITRLRRNLKMIYFKTLAGTTIRFKNSFNVQLLKSHQSPKLFQRYYADKKDIVTVATVVRIRTAPIWSVASYGDIWESIAPENYNDLPTEDQLAILNEFNDINETELKTLETYAQTAVIPILEAYCKTLDTNKDHIIDVRKTFAKDCQNLGFINMDMVDKLEDGLVIEIKRRPLFEESESDNNS